MDYWMHYLQTLDWKILGPYALLWGCVVTAGIATDYLRERFSDYLKTRKARR